MENIKNIREMSAIGSRIDNSDVNPIRRSTSLNANNNHIYETWDAEEESLVSRLTSGTFKTGPSSHKPLTKNKWFYRDSLDEVQGPFLTTVMAQWYSLGYFHYTMLMVKRACDEHFYTLGDLVRLNGNVPFSDTPFSEQDVKLCARIGVQHTPTLTMNESLCLKQQQLQYYVQYRPIFLKQRQLAIQSAAHQFSQCEKWNTMSPLEQHELVMNHMRNVTAPILPQPQPQTLYHMQQQQQHFNHKFNAKHNMHSTSPVNAPHHHQSLGSGEEKKKEKVRGFKEHEKKLKEDAERKKLEVELKRLEHEKKMKEVEEKRLQEEEKKRKAELKKKAKQKEKKMEDGKKQERERTEREISNNQNTDKQQIQKSNKTPAVTVNNNKNNVKNMTKSANQTVQQTNSMKKAIESRSENNNCNDKLSQWCCKHLAKHNMNTIDISKFVTYMKEMSNEDEIKDYNQNHLGRKRLDVNASTSDSSILANRNFEN